MSDDGDFPLDIEQIESTPLGRAQIGIRVIGRWRGRARMPDQRAFLVLEVEGRRHRFPAMEEPRRSRLHRSNSWSATFALPAWLEPSPSQQMSLWLGSYELQLPTVLVAEPEEAEMVNPAEQEPAAREPFVRDEQVVDEQVVDEQVVDEQVVDEQVVDEQVVDEQVVDERSPEPERPPVTEERREPAVAPRAADPRPAASVATGATEAIVAALRAELQQRAAAEAQLRARLTATKAELDGRVTHQTALEATQKELRSELQQLVPLIEEESARRAEVESRAEALAAELAELHQRVEKANSSRTALVQQAAKLSDELLQLRGAAEQHDAERVLFEARTAELTAEVEALGRQVAQSEVGRESASAEVTALRAELDRLGAELVDARGSRGAGVGLSEAQSLLVEARAVTARLRAGNNDQGNGG
jgi:hypothetical protein